MNNDPLLRVLTLKEIAHILIGSYLSIEDSHGSFLFILNLHYQCTV